MSLFKGTVVKAGEKIKSKNELNFLSLTSMETKAQGM